MTIKISKEQAGLIDRLMDDNLLIKEIAQKAGLPYNNVRAYIKGYKTPYDYQNHLVQQKGFTSYHEYIEYLERKRQKRPENKKMSKLIKKRLKELGKTQYWLSRKMVVSKRTVLRYYEGKIIPKGNNLTNLFSALEVHYKTLDEMMRDELQEFS